MAQCSISIPPENVRKPKVLRCFQGGWKWNIGLKMGAIFVDFSGKLFFCPESSKKKF